MAESTNGMTGLQQLQAAIASGEGAPIYHTLRFELAAVSQGRARFRAVPGTHAYNRIGFVHGGYAATLLDSACGCAVLSMLAADRGYTTLELKVAYHRALTVMTGEVTAEGVVISMGSRVAFSEAKLLDSMGNLCASATSTLMLFDKANPGTMNTGESQAQEG